MSPPPPAGAEFFSLISVATTSVVKIKDAMDAAFSMAERVTFTGSTTPAATKSTYSSVKALRPKPGFPLRQIAINAGMEGSVVVNAVRNGKPGFGLNALTEEYVDLVAAGVVDPVKVTRSAIENAASIASLILTTEVVATEIKEKNAAPAGGGGDMGGMGGMY